MRRVFTKTVCMDLCYLLENIEAVKRCHEYCKKDLMLAAKMIAAAGTKKYGKQWIEDFSRKWTLRTR